MKKFLSLVMALIMVMSLVTVASAADYTDAADIDSKEAVEVMSAVGVFQGSAGKFNPKAILNRAEAAKLIAYLDLGEKTAEALPAVKAFADVPETHWAAKYIAYCADAGYINGVGGNKFNPTGKLTGYQFGKLVLCVLGYDSKIEAFTGSNWSIAVAKLMKSNDIAKGVDAAPSAELTREDAAQYCLNALKATTVDYTNRGTVITVGGVEIATGASKAEPVTKAGSVAINATKTYGSPAVTTVELGEKLYDGDLDLSTGTDAFGRAADVWTYDNETVGKYGETPAAVFNAKTGKSTVATALKGYTLFSAGNSYKISTDTKVVDTSILTPYGLAADATKSVAELIGDMTANNKTVEFYANDDKQITGYKVINYSVGEITKITKKANGDVVYTMKSDGSNLTLTKYNPNSTNDDNFSADFELVEDAFVTYALGNDSVKYLYPATVKTGVATESKPNDYVIVDGTKYPLAGSLTPSTDKIDIVIDQFGTVVKSDAVSKSDVVYLAYKWTASTKYGFTTMGQFVDQDGKVTEIELENPSSAVVGPIEYYVTSDDTAWVSGVDAAEVKQLNANYNAESKNLDTDTVKLAGVDSASVYYYLADDVTFVNMKSSGSSLKVTTATGAQKVTAANASNSYMVVKDGEVITVFVPAAAVNTVDQKDLLFVASTSNQGSSTDDDGKVGTLYSFYQAGKKLTKIASGISGKGFYEYSIDSKTGRYELSGAANTYKVVVDLNGNNKVYAINKDTYVNVSSTLKDIKLAADCDFYDTTDNNLVDLASVVNAVENDDDISALDMYVVYDVKEEVITCVYIAKH